MAIRRTPETLTAVARAATLRNSGALPPLSLSPRPPTTSRTEAKNAAVADQARANLGQMGRMARHISSSPALDPRADANDSFSILPISEIEAYQHNPRTGPNPRYADLRASIVADGITNPITVTRRTNTSKYHPYGGGNTRLEIAKELQSEGDSRFDNLQVIVKTWPGDANVISAHLAENENRGDISFWEKARGVSSFKKAHEEEFDVVLSTGDLVRELKSHGINFGQKVIQNFAFAVDHLGSIGPWLKAKEVNEVVRPGFSAAMSLASKFDVQPSLFEPVLLKHRDQMLAVITFNEKQEEVNRKPVELDAGELVSDLNEALAEAIGVAPEVMPLMISAVESNSRISADDLRTIQVRKPPAPPIAQPPLGPSAAPVPSSAGPQRSLSGMLGDVPPAQPPASAPHPAPAVAPQTTSPLAPPQAAPTAAAMPSARHPGLPENVSADDPTVHVLSLVLDLSDLALLHDCILHVKTMPFGFLMDMPKALNTLGDKTLPEVQVQVRAAAWKLLASLSGQVDAQWFTHVDQDMSNWSRFAQAGPDAFRRNYEMSLRGITDEGNPAMLLAEVYLMFSQPELGYITVQLLRAMEQLRLDHPERFVKPVQSDSDYPD